MKVRTIEDIFDKEIGNRKFANFIKLANADNVEISDIQETYEYYKFKFNGVTVDFDKRTKDVRGMYNFIKEYSEAYKKVKERMNGK